VEKRAGQAGAKLRGGDPAFGYREAPTCEEQQAAGYVLDMRPAALVRSKTENFGIPARAALLASPTFSTREKNLIESTDGPRKSPLHGGGGAAGLERKQ
jgi:hypothetical protein